MRPVGVSPGQPVVGVVSGMALECRFSSVTSSFHTLLAVCCGKLLVFIKYIISIQSRFYGSPIYTFWCLVLPINWGILRRLITHPRRPRGSKSGREKRRDESFQVRAKEPLGADSHRTISKNSSRCRLLIGHKKCFVLLCPIGEQFLLSCFREFVHHGYCLDHGLSGLCTKNIHAVWKLSVWY